MFAEVFSANSTVLCAFYYNVLIITSLLYCFSIQCLSDKGKVECLVQIIR